MQGHLSRWIIILLFSAFLWLCRRATLATCPVGGDLLIGANIIAYIVKNYNMNGAELASMLKGQLGSKMNFNGIMGVDAEDLHLGEEDIRWWRDAKFGLFIHWGVYTVVGKGEWAYFNEQIGEEEYRRIAEEEFRPGRAARKIAEEWIDTAQ